MVFTTIRVEHGRRIFGALKYFKWLFLPLSRRGGAQTLTLCIPASSPSCMHDPPPHLPTSSSLCLTLFTGAHLKNMSSQASEQHFGNPPPPPPPAPPPCFLSSTWSQVKQKTCEYNFIHVPAAVDWFFCDSALTSRGA